MDVHELERLRLSNDLRYALERGEFRVYYQPKVHLESGRAVGVESLVRWEHPDKGLVLPEQFIPLAEETGLIIPLGRWILREACRQVCVMQERRPNDPPLTVYVNLSARQFRQGRLVEEVAEGLKETAVDPQRVVLEISETDVTRDAESITTLWQLKDLGVLLALDHFGTGYTSLSYFKRLPVDYLKIDRSFVDELGKDPDDTAVVSAIIYLGHAVGLEVIAEGVENAEQVARLREFGCDLAQGSYFSEPMPAEALDGLLVTKPRW